MELGELIDKALNREKADELTMYRMSSGAFHVSLHYYDEQIGSFGPTQAVGSTKESAMEALLRRCEEIGMREQG